MPRGFLVKRNSKWSPLSYRIRTEDEQPLQSDPLRVAVGPAVCPDSLIAQSGSQRGGAEGLYCRVTEDQGLEPAQGQTEETEPATGYTSRGCTKSGLTDWSAASCSPAVPTGHRLEPSALDRSCFTSSTGAEPSAAAEAIRPGERSLGAPTEGTRPGSSHPQTPTLPGTKRTGPDPWHRKYKSRPKKPKMSRKLRLQDEVSTSPVLGLRIKVDAKDCQAAPASAKPQLLAGYICQLCRETYSDPFSLAQHRCSRIVRVEYRCPECQKVFSCPANLASHRRWHKPRSGANSDAAEPGKERHNWPGPRQRIDPESKENSKGLSAGERRGFQTMDSSKVSTELSEGGSPGTPGRPERFECLLCSKRFRRQASLEKHLSGHQAASSAGYRRLQWSRLSFPCPLCNVNLPSADIRNKHLLWHAVTCGEPALLSPTAEQQEPADGLGGQLFTCKHCPSSFLSSAGLSRHINKSHPSENRQHFLLQLATRPGC
ncbi:insulinoma-associated protein 2 [Rhincodon typus]|uniref:insulinoma-associated protein 2 n=1 Tax=Rhincodon typus TaxID=259920 RepID=UPI00202DD31F|nr:insulinoma-associated protein 2 [Rhincodon typus]